MSANDKKIRVVDRQQDMPHRQQLKISISRYTRRRFKVYEAPNKVIEHVKWTLKPLIVGDDSTRSILLTYR